MKGIKPRKLSGKFCIIIHAPDGINYFQGIHGVDLSLIPKDELAKEPGLLKLKGLVANVWTIHPEDAKRYSTKNDADHWLKLCNTAGATVEIWTDLQVVKSN